MLLEWCPGAESNHRHADFQSAALPTELPGRAPSAARRADGLDRRPAKREAYSSQRGVVSREPQASQVVTLVLQSSSPFSLPASGTESFGSSSSSTGMR